MARQNLTHQLVLAETGGSNDEEIESLLLDIDAEFNRLQGPILSQRLIERFEFSRAIEVKLLEITTLVKCPGV